MDAIIVADNNVGADAQAGAKLLAADVRISLRLVFKVAMGKPLSRWGRPCRTFSRVLHNRITNISAQASRRAAAGQQIARRHFDELCVNKCVLTMHAGVRSGS